MVWFVELFQKVGTVMTAVWTDFFLLLWPEKFKKKTNYFYYTNIMKGKALTFLFLIHTMLLIALSSIFLIMEVEAKAKRKVRNICIFQSVCCLSLRTPKDTFHLPLLERAPSSVYNSCTGK